MKDKQSALVVIDKEATKYQLLPGVSLRPTAQRSGAHVYRVVAKKHFAIATRSTLWCVLYCGDHCANTKEMYERDNGEWLRNSPPPRLKGPCRKTEWMSQICRPRLSPGDAESALRFNLPLR